jgi:type VI secretion system protein ImpG
MFNRYYQDELTYLREMGREFSRDYPAVAHLLSERGSDPDVERLLEGFAFLTARVRHKLDDEFPEITHGLLNLLWPHYLRPVPSLSVLEFKPVPGAVRETVRIPRGTEVASLPVEGTRCRFRTCYDVDLLPVELTTVELEESSGAPLTLRLGFQMAEGASLKQLAAESLRLYFGGERESAGLLYLWINRHLKEIVCRGFLGGMPAGHVTLPASSVTPGGFSEGEALLPYPEISFAGFRLLQEYFALPAKFMFVDLHGLQKISQLEAGGAFELQFKFKARPERIPRLKRDDVSLACTPVINLFPHTADPIRLEHSRVDYRVRPASVNALHYEVYSIDRVSGWAEGQVRAREYASFDAFTHGAAGDREAIYYHTRLRPALTAEGTDTFISFVSEQQAHALPPTETVSIDLTCTNRNLPVHLRVGDICQATSSSPELATFRNITGATASVRPPLDQGLHWRLLSHLALNYLSLADIESLRSILEIYDFQALYDRQAARENELRLDSIQRLSTQPLDWLMKGVPIRGTSIEMELQETNFAGEGDMFLFGTVLNEFFALYASLNSFTRLTIRGAKQREVYQWAPRLGGQILA